MTPYYEDDAVTIYHGDCREILPTLGCAALTVTSPPYWNARTYEGGGIRWATYDEYTNWLREVLGALLQHTGWVAWNAGYIWKDGQLFDCAGDAARIARELGYSWRTQVPWVKDDYAPQPSIDLAPAHELIEILCTPHAGPSFFDELRVPRRQAARWGRVANERPSGGAQRGGGIGFGHERVDGMKQAPNVLVTKRLKGHHCTDHPAAFPTEIVYPWVTACSRPGDTVLDCFMGSGTTLRVAKDLGRKAIGIELEERYCEIGALRCAQEVLAL